MERKKKKFRKLGGHSVLTAVAALFLSLPTNAQTYGNRTYNPRTGQFEYSDSYQEHRFKRGAVYYGFRMGITFATVNSDDKALDGGSSRTGLGFGGYLGYFLSRDVPVFLESGVEYRAKGGRSTYEGKKMSYDLNYLEVPVVVKYSYVVDRHFSIQPFAGGYFAMGLGGKIKNYGDRVAESSFSGKYFKRFDGGLRIGCGFGFDMFYADINYDLGLTNISHDEFDSSHNRCLSLNFGVNF